MAKFNDCGFKFLMRQVITNKDDSESVTDEIDIEEQFPGLAYHKCSGLEKEGKPKLYAETFVEEDDASVFIPSDGPKEQTSISLTLYFFPMGNYGSDEEGIARATKCYHNFLDYISGKKIIYRDTGRKRKVIMYLSDEPEISTDRLYGIPYKDVTFKFTNLFGRSFDYDHVFDVEKTK